MTVKHIIAQNKEVLNAALAASLAVSAFSGTAQAAQPAGAPGGFAGKVRMAQDAGKYEIFTDEKERAAIKRVMAEELRDRVVKPVVDASKTPPGFVYEIRRESAVVPLVQETAKRLAAKHGKTYDDLSTEQKTQILNATMDELNTLFGAVVREQGLSGQLTVRVPAAQQPRREAVKISDFGLPELVERKLYNDLKETFTNLEADVHAYEKAYKKQNPSYWKEFFKHLGATALGDGADIGVAYARRRLSIGGFWFQDSRTGDFAQDASAVHMNLILRDLQSYSITPQQFENRITSWIKAQVEAKLVADYIGNARDAAISGWIVKENGERLSPDQADELIALRVSAILDAAKEGKKIAPGFDTWNNVVEEHKLRSR